jgi:hypothetical protein
MSRAPRYNWYEGDVEFLEGTNNAFCSTGPGGGIDPTCSPKGGRKGAPHGGRLPPSLKEFKEKGATKEEIAEFSKLNKQRSELNKKVKAGTATDEERAKRDVVLGKLADLRMAIRARHEAGDADKATILDTKTTREVESQKAEEPKRGLDYAEALRQKDKAAAEEAKKPFQQGEEATLDRMKNRLHRRPIDRSISDEMHAMMKEMERDSPDRSAQGMTTSEKMKLFKVDGLEVKYSEGARDAAAQTIVDVVLGEKLPKKLWNANDEILFSTQRNRDDAYWEKQFKESGFKSAATGGDGSVVVYNAEAISRGTFAHESGHNLAYREWGSPYPDATSRYSKAQSVESPVTNYGSKSHAEDFAEATRLYVDKWERDAFKRKFPLKHAALHEIITGEQYVGNQESTENVFCHTGEGGGIDPTCSPGKVGGAGGTSFSKGEEPTVEQVAGRINNRPARKSAIGAMREVMNELEQDVGVHNPSSALVKGEQMMGFKVAGIEVHYSQGARDAAAKTMADLLTGDPLPPNVWGAARKITFTTQHDKEEEVIATRHGMSGATSIALGGFGDIVVFNGNAIPRRTFAHESGHNIATREWHSCTPDPNSAYARAQAKEKPVSKYGAVHPGEDFAEAVRLYSDKSKVDGFRKKFPLKYEALHEIITSKAKPQFSEEDLKKAASDRAEAAKAHLDRINRIAADLDKTLKDIKAREEEPTPVKGAVHEIITKKAHSRFKSIFKKALGLVGIGGGINFDE